MLHPEQRFEYGVSQPALLTDLAIKPRGQAAAAEDPRFTLRPLGDTLLAVPALEMAKPKPMSTTNETGIIRSGEIPKLVCIIQVR